MITGLVFGYLCMFMLIQEMRSDHIRNLGVGDGVYEKMDAIQENLQIVKQFDSIQDWLHDKYLKEVE